MRTNHPNTARFLRSIMMALAAVGALAASAAAQTTVHLIAAPVTKNVTLPDGTIVPVPMWGYAEDKEHIVNGVTQPPNGMLDLDEPVTVPGPRIVVPPGGGGLIVHLTNLLPEATSLIIPGQPFAAAPARNADGRARSMTPETSPNGGADYNFPSVKPGTFLYQSGSHPAVQVQMGLYGAMTKDASSFGEAYPGVAYAHDAVLVFSEIDQALHAAVAQGTYGTPSGPTSTLNYRPSLFLINGESYTNESMATIPAGAANGVTLLRILNAGLRTHAPVLGDGSLKIIAEDGNKLPFAKDQATVMLAAGKTHDALWTPAADGVYSLYDRALSLNATASAAGQGSAGMLAKLKVVAAGTDTTVYANDDNYSTNEGTTLTVAAAGVLSNDTGSPTAANIVGGPGHAAAFTLNLDGSFTYTPAIGFFGIDSFTYTATAGSLTSAPAMVAIAVRQGQRAPIATPQQIGVHSTESVAVVLAGTDPNGDALSFRITALPEHGKVSIIGLGSVERELCDGVTVTPGCPAGALSDLHTATVSGTTIPGGRLIYTPAAGYPAAPAPSAPDAFSFVAYDGGATLTGLYSATAAKVSATVFPADVDPAVADLIDPVTLTVVGADGAAITKYRWTLEEDLTYKVMPGVADPNTLAVSFHKSYMPMVASGTEIDPVLVNRAKRYFVSVLPTVNNYSNTGGEIEVGRTALTVVSAKLPLPTARIRVQVFEDNAPLNGMHSGNEPGLKGFQVTIDDAGGTYGKSGGHQSTDAFGNKIGTAYAECTDPVTGLPAPGTCSSYQVSKLGDGFVLTDAAGIATIENLPMGKYTVKVRAPGGQKWIQTTTIEGQPGIDAWVKPNEPQFFTEFGPPGPHVLVGFVRASSTIPPGFSGSGSITGRITNMRMSRPPETTQSSGAPFDPLHQTRPWVALNSAATAGVLLYAQPVNDDGSFTIPNVAAGNYALVVFDSSLDLIIASRSVTVAPTGPTALGDVPVFSWFQNLYSYVYDDLNRNGHHDDGEPGVPDTVLNIRFRDGSIYQSLKTSESGFKAFNEIFPFFAWMIAEVDYTRFHTTGLTVVVDGGGVASAGSDWQQQAGLPPGLIPPNVLNPQPQAENVGKPFREESGADTPFLLLEGFQGFLGQSNVMLWGKAPYDTPGTFVEDVDVFPFGNFPGPEDIDGNGDGLFNTQRSNGGIAGIVHYTITRAENDPRWAVAENWEPGVADVRIQLWDETRTHLLNEGTTDNFNRGGLQPAGCQGPTFTFLGRQTDCYDGLRNFNQARPAAFDGGYAFSTILADSYDPAHPDAALTFNLPLADRKATVPLPAGKYVVKMVVPPGYKVQKEEDKNVDFGDSYVPRQFWINGQPLGGGYDTMVAAPPTVLATLQFPVNPGDPTITVAAGGATSIHPNDQIVIDDELMRVTAVVGNVVSVLRGGGAPVDPLPSRIAAAHPALTVVTDFGAQLAKTVGDNALVAPFCVGQLHKVPDYFSLFPGDPAPYGGEMRPLCDAKLINLRPGQQIGPDFHLFTDAPKSGHIYGMVLDDTTNEFDPNAPTFGEKYAPPYMPVAIRDWQGREITRVYTDQYGMYNALVPSTYTINPPMPSGVSPSILQACINAPTMPDPLNPARVIPDPLFQKQYSHFCYPLQYLPGKTTYLDTPVLPTGAFTGTGSFPVDAELPNRTPIIASVTGAKFNVDGTVATPASLATPFGPYIVDNGAADDAARTIVLTSAGKKDVANPAYQGPGSVSPKLITRDYGFGSPGGFVTLGGQRIQVVNWQDDQITAIVPSLPASPTLAQRSASRTGELAVERCLAGINAGTSTCNDGRKSVLGVTLNVATTAMHVARQPKAVGPAATFKTIQSAIDNPTTAAGDLILVQSGSYEEMVVMTKPVRLQGAGALSTVINVVTTPAENVQNWLNSIGPKLTAAAGYLLSGQPAIADPTLVQAGDVTAVIGGEGAGVTVLGKDLPTAAVNRAVGAPTATGVCLGGFGNLTNEAYCLQNEDGTGAGPVQPVSMAAFNSYVSTAWLRPNARIDGFSIIGASNAAGIMANGNNHYLEISNNKFYSNSGAFAGGIQLGHTGQLDQQNLNAHLQFSSIHNNLVTQNAGNQLGGGGGIVLGTGSGMYRVTENFIAGNFTGGQGAGISHVGNMNMASGTEENPAGAGRFFEAPTFWGTPEEDNVSVIDRNTIVFNEAFMQGAGTNGGGIFIGSTPPVVAGGPTTGTGNVRVSNNLIQGNAASGGDGGGVALMGLGAFKVALYNNIIANNVAAFAGGGISLAGTTGATVEIVHDTIVHNDSLATAGLAFTGPNQSAPWPAGIFLRSGDRPAIVNSLVWQNRSWHYGLTTTGLQVPGTTATYGLLPCATCAGGYWDSGSSLNPAALTMTGSTTSSGAAPAFVKSYLNTDRQHAYQQTEVTTILAPAALDEGGNFIRPLFGPLSLTRLDDTRFSNYHTSVGVAGVDLTGSYAPAAVPAALSTDIDTESRLPFTTASHQGADQVAAGFVEPPVAVGDSATTAADAPVTITVLANDTPAGGLVVTGVSQVVGGTATTDGTTVTYTPSTGFNGQGSFVYAISGAGGEASAPVTVMVGVATPVLSLSPLALNFGNVELSLTSAAPRIATVTNTGNAPLTFSADPITIVDLPVVSGNPPSSHYSLVANTCLASTTLAAGAQCTVSMNFNPTSIGGHQGMLTVNADAPAVSGSVSLTGFALSPATGAGTGLTVTPEPSPMTFGDVTMYQITASRIALRLTNIGNTAAEFTTSLNGPAVPQFKVTDSCPAGTGTTRALVAGGTCTVAVAFAPTVTGPITSTVTVTPTGGAATAVALSGTGNAYTALTVTPASLNFGNVTRKTPSAPLAVTITNPGTATAPVQLALTFAADNSCNGNCVNASPELFSQTGTCPIAPAALGVGASCQANVVFTPPSGNFSNPRTAALVVTPIGSPVQTVSLAGTGVPGLIAIPGSNVIAFRNVKAGKTGQARQVSIQNTGAAAVGISVAPISGLNADQFARVSSTCPEWPATLAAGATCQETVTLSPTALGAASATMSVIPSDGAARTVTLTGIGIASEADLSITKTAGVATIMQSATLTYTIVVTNNGLDPATGAMVLDARPAAIQNTSWSWSCAPAGANGCGAITSGNGNIALVLGTLASGTSVTISASGTVNGSGILTNTATVVAPITVADPNTLNNTATDSVTILPPSATLAPSVTFPVRVVGSPSPAATVTFMNTSAGAVTLRTGTAAGLANANGPAVGFTGTNASDFSLASSTCLNGLTIAAGATCTVDVRFTPGAIGSRSGSLNVYLAGATTPLATDALSGQGVAPSGTLSPVSVSFANQAVGNASASATLTFTNTSPSTVTLRAGSIANAANANGPAVAFTGSNPADFAVASGTTCANSASIAAGGTCTINVTFTPAAAGARTATLGVYLSGATTALTADPVNGTGVALSGTLAPNPVSFGNQLLGIASAATSVTFTNTTGLPITLRSGTSTILGNANGPAVGFNGANPANFAIAFGTTCLNGTTIAAGGTCTVNVTFTPSATGARAATLNIYGALATSATGLATDALSGTGVQSLAFTAATFGALSGGLTGPWTLAFGNQTGAVFSVVTLTNSGQTALTFGSATVTGTGFSKDLGVGQDTCSNQVVPVNGTCTIRVNFLAPAGISPRTGALSAPAVGATNNPAVLNLTGS